MQNAVSKVLVFLLRHALVSNPDNKKEIAALELELENGAEEADPEFVELEDKTAAAVGDLRKEVKTELDLQGKAIDASQASLRGQLEAMKKELDDKLASAHQSK